MDQANAQISASLKIDKLPIKKSRGVARTKPNKQALPIQLRAVEESGAKRKLSPSNPANDHSAKRPAQNPENRDHIFEPNYSTKHSLKKLGFGLWWVKAWVQRCGGSISLAAPDSAAGSPSPASGTTFVIRLPLAS